METLVVVTQHRNHYYSRTKTHGSYRFGSSPSGGFREINCRTFQSGAGILPTPLKSVNSPPATKRVSLSPQSSPYGSPNCEDDKRLYRKNGQTISIPINVKASNTDRSLNDEDLSCSELWAGPAYSNSPPPSSLPIPKFSLRQKRTVSLDLPDSASQIKIQPFAKSAPPSPRREPYRSPSDFFVSTDSATKNLRRILHLDINDE